LSIRLPRDWSRPCNCQRVDIENIDWRIFLEAQPNALLIGDEDLALSILVTYQHCLALPIVEWRTPAPLKAPPSGTLVIWDVDRLNAPQQRACLEWMDCHAASVQVISIAARTVFSLVQAGAFLPELYYHLNTVCLPLTRDAAALTAAHG
jgi:Sigma-54 interaction domain